MTFPPFKDAIAARFLRYVKLETTSNPGNPETPSSPGQWDLARLLEKELRAIGVADLTVTKHCYVIAKIAASPEAAHVAPLGFIAHLDTSDSVSAHNVAPQISTDEAGRTIVRSDGKTLLGADDKAGIAILMTLADYFVKNPAAPHPPLEIIFTPDEETGRGLPEFPSHLIAAPVCYTVDGGGLGEVEASCFNAYAATVTCRGFVTHPGEARGILVNAALMASYFAALLPRNESPEATDGDYGYYCLMEMRGTQDEAALEIIVRDFEADGMKRRLAALGTFARAVEAQFPGGTVRIEAKESYRNMREKIAVVPAVMEKLRAAAKKTGIALHEKPVRGGTDGARLTEMGRPAPNIFTGGYHFHSTDEYAVVEEMEASCRLCVALAAEWAAEEPAHAEAS